MNTPVAQNGPTTAMTHVQNAPAGGPAENKNANHATEEPLSFSDLFTALGASNPNTSKTEADDTASESPLAKKAQDAEEKAVTQRSEEVDASSPKAEPVERDVPSAQDRFDIDTSNAVEQKRPFERRADQPDGRERYSNRESERQSNSTTAPISTTGQIAAIQMNVPVTQSKSSAVAAQSFLLGPRNSTDNGGPVHSSLNTEPAPLTAQTRPTAEFDVATAKISAVSEAAPTTNLPSNPLLLNANAATQPDVKTAHTKLEHGGTEASRRPLDALLNSGNQSGGLNSQSVSQTATLAGNDVQSSRVEIKTDGQPVSANVDPELVKLTPKDAVLSQLNAVSSKQAQTGARTPQHLQTQTSFDETNPLTMAVPMSKPAVADAHSSKIMANADALTENPSQPKPKELSSSVRVEATLKLDQQSPQIDRKLLLNGGTEKVKVHNSDADISESDTNRTQRTENQHASGNAKPIVEIDDPGTQHHRAVENIPHTHAARSNHTIASMPTTVHSPLSNTSAALIADMGDIQKQADGTIPLLMGSDAPDFIPWDTARPTTPINAARTELAPHVARQLVEVMSQAAHRPVEIALSPQELGRVRMSVIADDGTITVNIIAERTDTLDLMRRHIDQLGQTFRNMGYDQINFAFGQGTQSEDQSSTHSAGQPSPSGESIQDENDTLNQDATVQIDLNAAPTHGVDIRL